jgi:diguanylate cyclase (GGDEF)-like protein
MVRRHLGSCAEVCRGVRDVAVRDGVSRPARGPCRLTARRQRVGLLDSAIVTCGLTMAFWVFVAGPLIGGGLAGGLLVPALAYPVLGLLLTLTFPLVLLTRPPTASPYLTLSRGRLTAFAVLAFLGPMAPVSRLRAEPVQALDVVVPALLAGTLSVLLVVRLGRLAGLAQRRAAELGARAEELSQSLREQAELQHQLSHRATHDAMTGLPNRALLLDRLERALTRPGGAGSHGLLLLDLDGFKDVNDTYGHPAGDELLAAVAGRLLGEVPGGDTLARLGGDEFAVLLENVTPEQGLAAANRLVAKARAPYAVDNIPDGQECYLTVSIGLVTTGPDARTPTELMRDADLALYVAKGAGKNQVAAFHPGLRTAHEHRTRLARQLRRALVREELAVCYQPVVDLRTGEIRALEALLRWTLPDGRQVPPAELVPVAEAIGLIVPIGDWLLRQACADARRWYARNGLVVSVNVSGRQLVEPDFADKVVAALRAADLPGEAVMLEITETVLVAATSSETDAVTSRLARLRERGVRIAIDDFGTGYSSLSYLRQLPVDVLKIDRMFTSFEEGDAAGDQHRACTRAILQLSGTLGLQTIAEGVETPGRPPGPVAVPPNGHLTG